MLIYAEEERLRGLASRLSMEQLLYHSRVLEEALGRMQRATLPRRATAEIALTRLCDPKLATGEEALLARIADLERKLNLLRTGAPLPSQAAPASASAPQAPAASEKGVAREAAGVPSSPANAAVVRTDTAEPSYRAFAGWREVVEEIARANPALAAPLSSSRAAISPTGHLVISVGNSFFLTVLNREEARATIRATAESIGEVTVTAVEVKNINTANGSDTILGELERALAECK